MIVAFLFAVVPFGWANDGVLFVNGNHLVPVQETDIELNREVLTISLGDDGYATVDVQYVLNNRGNDKTVTMGFEALAPYNDEVAFSPQGIHPYIHDFTVVMNGRPLRELYVAEMDGIAEPLPFSAIGDGRYAADLTDRPDGAYVLVMISDDEHAYRSTVILQR